jgi:lysozyme
MNVSESGLRLIERFEGFSSRPYFDPFGRVYTRGYGETEGINASSPPITQAEGQANLQRLVDERYAPAVRALGDLNQNEFNGLCSFVWNVGTAAIGPDTGLGRLLRERKWQEAMGVLKEYVRAGGVVLPGLVTRRDTEAALILTPVANPLDVLEPKERAAVDAYDADGRHPRLHAEALKKLRAELVAMRKAIWIAAERGQLPDGKATEKGWEIESRARAGRCSGARADRTCLYPARRDSDLFFA